MIDLRLAIFDVDGTLADSQAEIVGAMRAAFAAEGRAAPARAAILSIVGLSLDQAMARLAPELGEAAQGRLVQAYRDAYFAQRKANGASPLYPGARALLERLARDEALLMGVATGKTKRGLDALIEAHDLAGFFVTRQTADFHPSKPHPAMIEAALTEAGVDADRAVMIGDTAFDIDMAVAARTRAIGVSWGYHPTSALAQADRIAGDFEELGHMVETLWRDEA
ncbi:HAD-IA family hydrolase [Rhodalgimonas zhirmunskyi]|uniref:HAD-IA family hydrolase n=1 Tax=Rhodalgimonas zhirmunskyi TaxID=2964767 RepID=A0AAJ1X567_9RHOB|nr:HAD-IA family hydrolase [Rhodoalgimonas zhirmunskyi]MDQ2093859.1 HAD-IA family hydrolase [Rhodoalgimonas zhirmunskyi]